MTRRSGLIAIVILGAGAGCALPVAAEISNQRVVIAAASVAATSKANGEISKINKGAGTVTIKHGPIASLDMPAMTMPYRVRDPAMLDSLKAGDKIKFQVENVGGVYTLVSVDKVK